MTPRTLRATFSLAILALLASTASFAASKAEIDASAREALKQFRQLNPTHRKLEKQAEGVLIFPQITKGGVGVAGEYGEGVLRIKGTIIGYYSLTSASIGLTLGIAKHSEIILFMTPTALNQFTTSKGWSVGADTGVAVVSQGAGGEYDSKTLQKPVLAFVFGEKGLIGDASIEGSKVNKIDR